MVNSLCEAPVGPSMQGLAIVPVAVVAGVEDQPVSPKPEQVLREQRETTLTGGLLGAREMSARAAWWSGGRFDDRGAQQERHREAYGKAWSRHLRTR
ncbi:hypothetical protein DV20_08900 [Amycolatopsis rifamycinica]|uniref:Uncharacterized protein n=1 Tax=Amycolatopsis rifamycinica TaxID=287986 RepID=A0A066U608_9PSEU|nr:hypothetical protein DV20_08900 [Amycolatopsis rifamycinica]